MAVMNRTLLVRQSPKVPSVCKIKAAFMMGIDKCVKEAQDHNTILKAPQEQTGDQVL